MSLARSGAVKSGKVGKRLARRIRTPWIVAAALAVVLVASTCVPPPPTGGTVYLTFDDGPSVYTPQILSVLAAKGAPATFFVVGEHVVQFPSLVQQEHADGHGIGDHSWSHPDLTTLPPGHDTAGTRVHGRGNREPDGHAPHVVASAGRQIQRHRDGIASSLGLSMRLWDVNPQDFLEPGADVIVSRVVDNVSDGDIVLLHDGSSDGSEDRSQTVAALPTIIDTLRARGFEFGTLSTTTGAPPDLPVPTSLSAESKSASQRRGRRRPKYDPRRQPFSVARPRAQTHVDAANLRGLTR